MSSEDSTSDINVHDSASTPTDLTGHYVHGRAVLGLTDRLNAAASYEEAAQLTDQVLEPTDGLLERLAVFEAAAEKAKESEREDGFDLCDDLQEAAVTVRDLGENLHVAVDRMRALAAPPRRNWQEAVADYYAPSPGSRTAPSRLPLRPHPLTHTSQPPPANAPPISRR
ncbi:hypothetical protein ACFS5L_02255 [Streptomyces phyllanthi]